MNEEKAYGIIVEWKDQPPIVMEGPLLTHEEAYQRMQRWVNDGRTLRVAIFKAAYAAGHPALAPKLGEAA